MLKRLAGLILAAGLVLPVVGHGAEPALIVHFPLFIEYDFRQETTDDDQVVADVLIVDSTALTVLASPDTCQVLTVVLTDADNSVSAGSVVFIGTDQNGNYVTETLTGIGSAVGNDTDNTTNTFCTVTSATTGVFTGEGAGDNIKIGTLTASLVYQFPILLGPRTGNELQAAGDGEEDNAFQPKRPFDWFFAEGGPQGFSNARVETAGYSATVVSSTGGSSHLRWVDASDAILVRDNQKRERVFGVLTNADDDTITVSESVDLGTDGVGYRFKKLVQRSGLMSGWFDVTGAESVNIYFDVADIEANLSYKLECRPIDAGFNSTPFIAVGPNTITNGSDPTTVAIMETGAWSHCRFGILSAGTNTAQSISAYVIIRRGGF